MAKVIDIDNYVAVRDYNDFIHVFIFIGDNMLSRNPINIVSDNAKVYFQCANEETFVGNKHSGFYKAPNARVEDLNQEIIRNNYQKVPWEVFNANI